MKLNCESFINYTLINTLRGNSCGQAAVFNKNFKIKCRSETIGDSGLNKTRR